MPPVEVKRLTAPRTRGLQYNGENFIEVLDFYLKGRYPVVNVNTHSLTVTLSWVDEKEGEHEGEGYTYLCIGDWIVQEDNEKFVVPASDFARKFVQHPPPDHKLVSTATGKEVSWEETGTYDHRRD